jgi:hypothetical protein
VNRIKATLARLGIRNFKPTLRKAAELCERLSRETVAPDEGLVGGGVGDRGFARTDDPDRGNPWGGVIVLASERRGCGYDSSENRDRLPARFLSRRAPPVSPQ